MKLANKLRKKSALAMAVSMGVGSVVIAQPTQVQGLENIKLPQTPKTTEDAVTVVPQKPSIVQTTANALTVTISEDYGVGQGIEWPKQIAAPFIDMVTWVADADYSNEGVPNLAKLAEDTGVKFYNLGFIQSTNSEINGDRLAWSWGGKEDGFTESESNSQYKGIKTSIRELREMNGDVTISFGGAQGTAFWSATQDVEILTNTYTDLINGYGLTRVDLSIVGNSLADKESHRANAAAIKRVQQDTSVSVVLTVPVLPDGLENEVSAIIEEYLKAGVEVELVNLMTMNYGSDALLADENYGTASVRAVDNAKNQLQDMYVNILGQELSDRAAYGLLGTTPSVGFENSAHPVFTQEWMQVVTDHADEKELGMVSLWSMNRDAQLISNSGVNHKYEFTDVIKNFPINEAPIIEGVEDVIITQGNVFDVLEGVTATDKEDGDLTDVIKVEGTVDTDVADTYIITYSVADRSGLETSVTRTVIVNEAPVIEGAEDVIITQGDTFDVLEGVTATDKEDGDLTGAILVEGTVDASIAGTYTITYTVVDSEGIETVVQRIVVVEAVVEENEAPTIEGIEDTTITEGGRFDPLEGITATDKEDGDLTAVLEVEGAVNTKKEGIYTLTYSVSDSKGLQTTAQRVVTVKEDTIILPEVPEFTEGFGVGQGIQWPEQVAAPFVDMAGWVTKPGYANNGAPNLAKFAEDTGVKFYNLGFIQSVGGQIKDDKLVWGWGGYNVLSENQNNDQYEGIKQSIRELREMGGDVTISLGGLTGTAFWEATQNVEILTNTYMELVEGYGLTRLDLDIEGPAQDRAKNEANAKAIKRVQDATGIEVVLTLPVLPSGLTYLGLGVVEAYLEAGVDIEIVNLMTMCYGPATLLPGENYGTGSLRAVDSTKDQLQDMYRTILGQELSDETAYGMLGTTTSIGFEGSAHPIFTKEWKQLVVDHANEKDLGMVSFWSMNRDAQVESNKGVNYQYEFTNVLKDFEMSELPDVPANQAPTLRGVSNVTITQGDLFNPLEGVTARDKEDGDLTYAIEVAGEVNTQIPGIYTLTYTVADSEGLEGRAVRIVTVEEVVVAGNEAPVIAGANNVTITVGDAFDALEAVTAFDKEDGNLTHTIQVEGAVNTEVAGTYTLIYTVVDQGGLVTRVTRIVTVQEALNPNDPNNTYDPNKVYIEGDKVIYNGKEYTAKWWTQGEIPGQSDVWAVKKEVNTDGTQQYSQGTIYNVGDVVVYNGEKYTAKWWTTSVPGSDGSWESAAGMNPDGSQEYIEGKAYVLGDVVSYEGELYEAQWWTKATPGSDASWIKR